MTLAFALSLVPLLLLVAPLLCGRYLGADRLERIAARRARPGRPRAPRIVVHRRPERFAARRLLLARHIAGRAPPLTA